MNSEKPPQQERNEWANDPLAVRVYSVRREINNLTTIETLFEFQDRVYEWNAELKKAMAEKSYDVKYLQEVPAWQALIGGTPEPSPTIPDEVKEYVEAEVEKFIKGYEGNT